MKKLLRILVALVPMSLVGCNGTNAEIDTKFPHVHLKCGNTCIHDDVVSYWFDYDGSIVEINTKTYGWIMVSEDYMLYSSDKCPLCNK